MKDSLFQDLLESIKSLPTNVLKEMEANMKQQQMREEWFLNKVEEWHCGAGEGLALHEYLGMSFEQYGEYLKQKSNTVKEEFERWAVKERGYSVERFESELCQYVEQNTHVAWIAWKASREHLVVNLPSKSIYDSYEVSHYKHDVEESLTNQGIKWK